MGQIPANLLNPLLNGSIDDIPVDRLWGWLTVASRPDMYVPESDLTGIRFRLRGHREKLKELIAYGVEMCVGAEDPESCMRGMERVLFGARPFDFGPWCLDRVLSATTEGAAPIYIGTSRRLLGAAPLRGWPDAGEGAPATGLTNTAGRTLRPENPEGGRSACRWDIRASHRSASATNQPWASS